MFDLRTVRMLTFALFLSVNANLYAAHGQLCWHHSYVTFSFDWRILQRLCRRRTSHKRV